jgi:flagellar basal-body rod protein FlgF/flagellar basal-body rod protein FlgG
VENTLLVGLSRQIVLERSMDVVANNLANMNTTGYKSENPLFEDYLRTRGRENRFNVPDRPVEFVLDRGTWHDFTQGALKPTGAPLDIGIKGDGFLVVQTPNGERYTRNGSLQINNQGQLVTSQGYPVLSDGGPIVFQDTDHDISISSRGRVAAIAGISPNNAETLRGTLRLVRFDSPQLLQKEGENLYSVQDGAAPAPVPDTDMQFQQGYVEGSNVNSVLEMTRMLQISRAYTAVANVLQQQSDLHKNAIQQLANVPA